MYARLYVCVCVHPTLGIVVVHLLTFTFSELGQGLYTALRVQL